MEEKDKQYYLDIQKILEKRNTNNQPDDNAYKNAQQSSQSNQKIKYGDKKKKIDKDTFKKVITSIIITLVIAVPTSSLITNYQINNNNAVVAINNNDKLINEKVREYQMQMNASNKLSERIESVVGWTGGMKGEGEALVDYSPDNLSKHIKEAAKKSELEARCVIRAAYNIINEPYRDETIGTALATASTKQENEELNYTIPSSSKEFLETLGYKDWNEYRKEEVKNIAKLQSTIDYIGGKNR